MRRRFARAGAGSVGKQAAPAPAPAGQETPSVYQIANGGAGRRETAFGRLAFPVRWLSAMAGSSAPLRTFSIVLKSLRTGDALPLPTA